MDGAGSTTKLNPQVAGDVEEGYYHDLGAGRRCLFSYSDDTVWHEALIGLVFGLEHAVIYTPDGDLYVGRGAVEVERRLAQPELAPESPSLSIQRSHH